MNSMISIVKDFSKFPAGRYNSDGPNSGEKFRDEVLIPELEKNEKVTVQLDGALGFGSSFLEEAFGGLVRRGYTYDDLKQRLAIESSIKTYKSRIWQYIEEQENRSKKNH